MADDPKVPNVNNFKDAVSLSQKIAENLKANEEIIKRTNSLLNDNSKVYSKISESLQKISKGLEEENARLEKAKRLEIEKKDIKKLSNTISNKANEIHNQNEKIQKRINHLNRQAITEAKNKVDYAKRGVEITRDQILSQEVQLEYDKKHNNLSATEIENRIKSIRAAEEKLKQQEEELTKTKSILEGREKELNVLKEAQVANEKIVDELNEQSKVAAVIAKHYTGNKLAVEAVNGTLGKLSKIPIAKNFIDANKATKAMTKNIEKGGSGIGTLFKGLAAGIKGLETASVVLTIFQVALSLFNLIKDAMFAADKRITDLAKSFSISKDEAAQLRVNLQGAVGTGKELGVVAEHYLATEEEIIATQLNFNKTLGVAYALTERQLAQFTEINNLLGLSTEAQKGLYENTIASNQEAGKMTQQILGQSKILQLNSNIFLDDKEILDKTLKTTGAIRANFKGNTAELAKGVTQAKLMGTTLEQMKNTASGLLDFESSIESELEAELLTGKQLNFERARYYALTGDMTGLMEELNAQNVNFGEYTNMNVLAQEALAKTFNMSRDDFSDMLFQQQILAELSKKTGIVEQKALKEKYDQLVKEGKLSQEIGATLGQQVQQQLEQQDAAAKFDQAVKVLKDTLVRLVDGKTVNMFVNFITELVGLIQDFVTSVKKNGLASTLFGGGMNEAARERIQTQNAALEAKKAEAGGDATKIAEIQKQQEDLYKQAKEASKMENQTHLAAVGTGAGVGATIGTLIFPGVGTAIGAVLGGYIGKALATEDYTKGLQSPIPQMAEGGIITRPTKVIAGEAGAEAIIPLTSPTAKTYLGNTNSDNSELISLMKDFIQAARAPKEIVIQNNMAIDSQKWALESSKHNVQFNT